MAKLKTLYRPNDAEFLHLIRSVDGEYFTNRMATWRLRLTIQRLYPDLVVRNYDLRKHLRDMESRGLLKSENDNGNNITWILPKGDA